MTSWFRRHHLTVYAERRRGSFSVHMAWDPGPLRVRPGNLAENLLNEAWAHRFQYKGFRFRSQSGSWLHSRLSSPATCMFWLTSNLSTVLFSVTCNHDASLPAWREQHEIVNMCSKTLPRMTMAATTPVFLCVPAPVCFREHVGSLFHYILRKNRTSPCSSVDVIWDSWTEQLRTISSVFSDFSASMCELSVMIWRPHIHRTYGGSEGSPHLTCLD